MAQPFLFADLGLMFIKAESTYGLNPGTLPSADTVYCRNMKIKPVINMIDKPRVGPYHLSPGSIAGATVYDIEFEVPLPGVVATDPSVDAMLLPDWADAMSAAGFLVTTEIRSGTTFANTVKMLPSTFKAAAGQGSLSLECFLFKDGADLVAGTGIELWEANGCVFNVQFMFHADEECYLKFTGKGLYARPADLGSVDISGLSFDAPEDALVCKDASVLTVGGSAQIIRNLQIDMGWQVVERKSMAGPAGHAGFMITRSGSITGSYDVEARLESVDTRWADVEGLTGASLDLRVTTPQNVGLVLEMPNIQLGSPDNVQEGIMLYNQPFFARDLDGNTFDSQIGMLLSELQGTNPITHADYDIFP